LLSRNVRGQQVERLGGPVGVVGANFSFRRHVYEQIGGFRHDLDRSGTSLMAGVGKANLRIERSEVDFV
jgi:hypothetical protein